MKFIVAIAGHFLFGGNNSSESCLDSSDTKEDYTAKAFYTCGGEQRKKGREVTLGLDLLWPDYVLDNSHFWGSEGSKLWTESICEETLGIKFYARHLNFPFNIQI